jgi:COMPASS component SWD3
MKMKENGDEFPGHSNRVFCLKFNPYNPNLICSGGWDNTVQIYDVRKRGPVMSLYGPHICGDAIDYKSDGHTILTGSYRDKDVLELWDLRTKEKVKTIEWNGTQTVEQKRPD